jgi:hypothetical protein
LSWWNFSVRAFIQTDTRVLLCTSDIRQIRAK